MHGFEYSNRSSCSFVPCGSSRGCGSGARQPASSDIVAASDAAFMAGERGSIGAPMTESGKSLVAVLAAFAALAVATTAFERVSAQETAAPQSVYPAPPAGPPPPLEVADAVATTAETMKPYRELIPGSDVGFELVPIRGGRFVQGSAATEKERKDDEGPQREVELAPFWIGKFEVTWDEYHLFMQKLDLAARKEGRAAEQPQDRWADAVSRPTPPYVP